MMDVAEVLLDHIDELTSVLHKAYTGGDFCAGLAFGYNGSHVLTIMAEHMVNQSEWSKNYDARLKEDKDSKLKSPF